MRKFLRFSLLSLALIPAFLLAACPHWKVSRKQGAASHAVLKNFSHQTHKAILDKEKIHCSNCHLLWAPLPKDAKKSEAERTSRTLMFPGKEECHYCHQNEAYATVAPQQCRLCHKDSRLIMPDNHHAGWMQGHKFVVKTEKEDCRKCHSQDYCVDCHLKRDTIRQRVHDRNFVFMHSIEARGNPRACSSCHALYFCKDCHATRGVLQ